MRAMALKWAMMLHYRQIVAFSRQVWIIIHGFVEKESISPHVRGGVIIGNHVWIGADAIILPGVEITGEYIVIGAGAIVTRNITEGYCVYVGNPASKIKNLSEAGFATADK